MSEDSDGEDVPHDQTEPQRGPDEVFCTECGAVIKERAEICPECGVRQQPKSDQPPQQQQAPPQEHPQTAQSPSTLSDRRQYELEKIASKEKMTVALVGFLISPLGYWMIGKKGLAILNFLTLNYFLLGVIIVPIHCYSIINNAEEELRLAGIQGY